MKKLESISALAFALLIVPTVVLAQQGQGLQQQNRVQDPTTHEDSVVAPQGNQVQNQVKPQNAGEDSRGRSDAARQNMSNVAQKVEELLSDEVTQGGIGQQVKTIAQQQKQAQGEITGQLNKLELRQGLIKKLFGADQKVIKNLKQQLEQNQLRIQQLQRLQNQVTNQAEETQIQELVQALVEQNTSLEDQIQAEEQVGSVFGWLLRLFN